jgi:hypothetical protein
MEQVAKGLRNCTINCNSYGVGRGTDGSAGALRDQYY